MSKSSRIVDLEEEVAELQHFRDEWMVDRDEFFHRQSLVLAEHSPMKTKPLGGTYIELRCRRCRTDEHHTWAIDNFMLWPCPTVQAIAPQYAANDTAAERDSEGGE